MKYYNEYIKKFINNIVIVGLGYILGYKKYLSSSVK